MGVVYIPFSDKLCLNDLPVLVKHKDVTIIAEHSFADRPCLSVFDIEKEYDYIKFCDYMRKIPIGSTDGNTTLYELSRSLTIAFYCLNAGADTIYCNENNKLLLSLMPNAIVVKNLPVLEGKQLYSNMTLKEITKMLNKYAFSGGCDTKEEQIARGANLEVDDCYKIISTLGDTEMINRIADNYGANGTASRKMLSGEVKKECAKLIYDCFRC